VERQERGRSDAMAPVPDLSCLALHEAGDESVLPVIPTAADEEVDAASSSAAYTTPPPKRPMRLKGDNDGDRPKSTLVAKLLKHRGSSVNAWGKGSIEFLAGPVTFLAMVRYLRDNTTYPQHYDSIRNLRTFLSWNATNLLPDGLVCNEMDDAMADGSGWLSSMEPAGLPANRGYYIRRDWSDKKVFVLGDFHGSLHSLLDVFLDMIDQGAFKNDGSGTLADDVAVVCLGDLLDRSPYTLECFYLMLRLCRENPEQCVLTAGNHETDERQWETANGTAHEIRGEKGDKCPTGTKTFTERMQKVTRALPSALIVKTSLGTLQLNHGSYEQFVTGKKETDDFIKFVQFDPEMPDTMATNGTKGGNPLQWADVAVEPAPTAGGRATRDAQAVAGYLKTMGLSMLLRGHSDLANLSLLYAMGSEPPQALDDENAVENVPDKIWYLSSNYGYDMQDPRTPSRRPARGNTFVRKGYDFSAGTNPPPLYDMYTLHEAPNADSFDKHLVTEAAGAQDLLVVTVASCPFSKPLPPVSMMSCYLAIGL